MAGRTKINVHATTLLMEFGDNLVQFNIFEAMKHLIKDHSLFSINIIDELIEEYMQLGIGSVKKLNFDEIPNLIDCYNSVEDVSDSVKMPNIQDLFDFMDNIANLADLGAKFNSTKKKGTKIDSNNLEEAKTNSNIQEEVETDSNNLEEAKTDSNNLEEVETNSNYQEELETDSKIGFDSSKLDCKQTKVEFDSGRPIPHSDRVGQLSPTSTNKFSPLHSPPTKLKPLSDHLKYAYQDDHQHFPIITANILHQEQKEKLLHILRKHQNAIGWTLLDLPRINPFICMHKILLEEEARPIRQ
ncbi:hypothetical protein CR513_17329, partial [Mucuna pruriens]